MEWAGSANPIGRVVVKQQVELINPHSPPRPLERGEGRVVLQFGPQKRSRARKVQPREQRGTLAIRAPLG
jgi:hypothetical protein